MLFIFTSAIPCLKYLRFLRSDFSAIGTDGGNGLIGVGAQVLPRMWSSTSGERGDGPRQFEQPCGMTLTPDGAFLLVVDEENERVAVIRANGTWLRSLWGPALLYTRPRYIAVVPSTGEVLITRSSKGDVVRLRSIEDDTEIGHVGPYCNNISTAYGLAVLDDPHCPPV
jgi:hypothetical protein